MVALSVIIPTHNRIKRLQRVIAAFENQTYPLDSFELIVISDASSDGTNEYLAALQTPLHFRFVIQDHGGPAKARNTGVANAEGAYILFVDDDVVPSSALIAQHMRLHDDPEKRLVVLGPMLTPTDFAMAPWVQWEQAMLMKQYRAMEEGLWPPTARQFYTGNTSLRRDLVVAVGGFDEHFRRAEDVELAYRLSTQNVQFVFNSQAIGFHYADRSFESWVSIPYAYGRNDGIFATTGGQDWLLPSIRTEFAARNPLSAMLVRVCLGRPAACNIAVRALRVIAAVSNRVGLAAASQMAYSGIFSVRYYQGLAEQLGTTQFLSAHVPTQATPLNDAG